MPASEAQIAASRLNGSRSRGPITPEGKARSRENAVKHGLAGEGVVLNSEEAAEVERRAARMLDEMRPATEMGRYLVRRLAGLTVRVERSGDHERAMHAYRVAHAEEAFDAARLAEVEALMSRIGEEPATSARRLRAMPEGVDRLLEGLLDLRDLLNAGVWDPGRGERLANLLGLGWMDVGAAPLRTFTEILGASPADPARSERTRAALVGLIEGEFDRLQAHRETLDVEAIERDRLGAPARAGFDPSREACLARRYEAAAERGVFQTLREVRRVEAEAAERAESAPATAPPPPPPAGPSGSFRAGDRVPPTTPPAAPNPRSDRQSSMVEGPDRAGTGGPDGPAPG